MILSSSLPRAAGAYRRVICAVHAYFLQTYLIAFLRAVGPLSAMLPRIAMKVLCIVFSLCCVEVYSESILFPYVYFGGNLPNHSYVDLTLVGNNGDSIDSVVCNTNVMTCCTSVQGNHRGHWYFPDQTILRFTQHSDSIYMARGNKRVDLRRDNNVTSPSGIYHCDIPTNIPSQSPVRLSVYVGLYPPNEGNRDGID